MPESPSSSGFRSQVSGLGSKQLEHFRSDRKRLPLHPLEAPGVETYDDAMLDLLRRKLFGPRDYGVIARKRS